MRDNYNEHGVDEYYRKVAATYRNPFFPGIKKVIWALMKEWWAKEGMVTARVSVLDMAAGSGEATLCLLEWEQAVRTTPPPRLDKIPVQSSVPLIDGFPGFDILATDPYTFPAYLRRTSRTCFPLSFADLANGVLPPNAPNVWDIVICSFAMHLVNTPSELFALLYELSTKARWLVILAPHKKPEAGQRGRMKLTRQIKEGWGWSRWDLEAWGPGQVHAETDIVQEK
ncbi:hypothetical protein BCR39DRAFT_463527 [Naematelia encephala]|uniref:Methyltransferase domain-containing protein n=1 Tax=Naematelia encephala TaxID=71784 RepID=A0A1Y2BH00_9TREE|nr:hypothetical protein BCR39DRAFT_463527 [Naematelia encephala]